MGFKRANLGAAKLTPQQVMELRRKYIEGYTQGQLAREYQVSVVQIGRICRGESWQQYQQAPHPDEIAHSKAVFTQLSELDGVPAVELTPAEIERLNRELMEEEGRAIEEVLPSTEDILNRRAARAALKEDSDESVQETGKSSPQGEGSETGTLERGSEGRLAEVQGAEGSAGRSVAPDEEAEAGEV